MRSMLSSLPIEDTLEGDSTVNAYGVVLATSREVLAGLGTRQVIDSQG